ncbi:DUF6428 family protein [soil metagenome]
MLSVKGLKNALRQTDSLHFRLSDGESLPLHFHITEAGLVTKHFIDCGGTIRKESALTMQIWYSDDLHHRLTPATFLKILDKAEPFFGDEDLPVEIEYQTSTIGKYNLEFDDSNFQLIPKQTDCLAKNQCGTDNKSHINHKHINADECVPATGCC